MKNAKKVLFSLGLVLLAASLVYSQQTSAPDQGTSTNVVTDQPNTSTTEKEVIATNSIVYNDGKIDYVSADVRFVINAKDEGSGVKRVFLMLDDSQFGVYNKPFTFFSEGKHLIGYKVEDNVDNISLFKSYEFIMDKSAPLVSLSSDKKPIKVGDVIYVGSNYNFGIAAEDTLSGVKDIEYKIDEEASVIYQNQFAPVGTNGFHKITYKASDNVGNASLEQSYLFFMDLNSPVLTTVIEPDIFEKDGIKYVSPSAQIKLIASDTETGVANISYTIDDGAVMDYSYPIRLTSGTHTIKAKAFDMVGNASQEVSLTLTVDSKAPEADLVPTK
jgi:hypothetical protein